MKYLIILGWFFIIANAYASKPKLTLATTAWCPYTCPNGDYDHGVIGEYVQQVFKQTGVSVGISSYPWSRAVALANNNQVDGLLTATPVEAPDMLFSSHPISSYQVCFYSHLNSDWHYHLPLTLADKRLGIIQDYGYGEPLDSYLESNLQSKNIVAISGNKALERLVNMQIGRAHV